MYADQTFIHGTYRILLIHVTDGIAPDVLVNYLPDEFLNQTNDKYADCAIKSIIKQIK